MRAHSAEIAAAMAARYDASGLAAIRRLLEERGTLRFQALPNGLFPAATARARHTGYQAVWVRDNVHIANALMETGDAAAAVRTVVSLAGHFERQAARFDAIIADPALASSPRNRPHVKFNGYPVGEIPDWSHDQNDALGYFLWIFCRMARHGLIRKLPDYAPLLMRFVRYFDAIRYWIDRDSGHWEERRRNSASSVGAALAGLSALRELGSALEDPVGGVLDRLIHAGHSRLDEVLPSESIDPPPGERRYDASLLFLIYPLTVVQWPMAERILNDVHLNLEGEYGIRRYPGDSFWCTDYRSKVGPEERTRDYSGDMETRDRLLAPGEEAQWCVFDPVVSAIWARRYLSTGDEDARERQTRHFNRALGQISSAFECPELWHWETAADGERVLETSEATPLVWTQANLLLALNYMERSASR